MSIIVITNKSLSIISNIDEVTAMEKVASIYLGTFIMHQHSKA
jgi:hypothetical protein